MRKPIFYFLLLASLISCNNESLDTVTSNLNNTKKCKSLFIIAEDRSGSASSHRKLTANNYKSLLETFQKNNNK